MTVQENVTEIVPKKEKSIHVVGEATPSKKVKGLYKKYVNETKRPLSLKQFVKANLSSSADAKLWINYKHNSLTKAAKQRRLDTRGATIAATAIASKNARRKSKIGGGNKPSA